MKITHFITINSKPMKTQLKSTFLAVLFILISFPSFSQIDIGADFVSRYLWRGQLLANGPAIQPSISYTKGFFEVGGWGSYGFAEGFDGTEADIYTTFTIGPVSLTITDYYFPSDSAGANFDNYFDFDEETTRHVFEGMIGFSKDDNPISVNLAYDFYGDDSDNSFYVNIKYALNDETEFFIEGGNGWYTVDDVVGEDAFGIVGIGLTHTKEIKISDSFSLPLFGTISINPQSEKLFLIFGMSF